MIKEAIKYIAETLSPPNYHNHGDATFCDKTLHPVAIRTPKALEISTLKSLVEYVRSEHDRDKKGLLIHVAGSTEVRVLSTLDEHNNRDCLAVAHPQLPESPFTENRSLRLDAAIPAVQSLFQDSEDRPAVLQALSHVTHEASLKATDDGTSQELVLRSGIKKVYGQLPNPVELREYCTFPEVEQPVRKYVLRLHKKGEDLAMNLYPADGNAWIPGAITRIGDYLRDKLPGVMVIG